MPKQPETLASIVKLVEHNNDAKSYGPEDALEEALADLREGKRKANKILILFLHSGDQKYTINWQQAGMSASEMVALLTLMQHKIIREDMGL